MFVLLIFDRNSVGKKSGQRWQKRCGYWLTLEGVECTVCKCLDASVGEGCGRVGGGRVAVWRAVYVLCVVS